MAKQNPGGGAPNPLDFPATGSERARRGFLAALVGVAVGGLLLLLGAPLPEHRALAGAGYLLGGASWAAALVLAKAVVPTRALLVAVGGTALLLRLLALGADPGLSDDIHRYVWEGSLVAEGTSPYAAAPADPARAAEQGRWPELYGKLNHPEVSAAYPPLAQFLFAGILRLAPDPASDGGAGARLALRAAFGLADLGVFAALALWLLRSGRSPLGAVAWGLSPLVAFEFAGAGHFDVLALLPVSLALVALGSGRSGARTLATAGLALGGAIKVLPLLGLPFVLRGARRPVALAVLAAGILVLSLLPLTSLDGGFAGLGSGLSEYALRWESFNLVSRWIERPLEAVFERDGSPTDPRRLARGVLALLGLWIFVATWRGVRSPERAVGGIFAGVLVLTPTLHPWYLALVVPFLARWPRAPWIWLVGVIPLTYWPLTRWRAEGVWEEPRWLWFAVAVPFFLLLARELRSRRTSAGTVE